MGRREMKWRRQRAGGTAGPGEWHVLAGSCRCLLAGERQAGGQMSTRKTQGKGYCKQEPGETGKVCQARHRQTDREAQATGSSFITCLLTSFTRISSASLSSSQ